MGYVMSMTDMQKVPKRQRALRLEAEAEDDVRRVAERDGLTWSEAARRMLKYAGQKMPAGWHR